jgi:hypothetical protein
MYLLLGQVYLRMTGRLELDAEMVGQRNNLEES